MATLYMSPITMIIQYLTDIGIVAAGGQINTFVAGSSLTRADTYTDSTGLTKNPNPLTLNSAGRNAASNGAPSAYWTQAGVVLRLIAYDAAGNRLVDIDQIQSINDLTNSASSIQTLLASPASSNQAGIGPVAGADLVANAVKSYDVFASVRSANVPNLAAGQTLVIEVQGGLLVQDGLGGKFAWIASLTATDDGYNILKPNGLTTLQQGRYARLWDRGVALTTTKTSAQQVVNSTTLTADTQLFQTLTPGTWEIKARLQLIGSGGTGQGYQVSLGFSGTVLAGTNNAGVANVSSNGTPSQQLWRLGGSIVAAAVASANGDYVDIDQVVVVSGLGSLGVQFCQNASSSNATIMQQGSSLLCTRIA